MRYCETYPEWTPLSVVDGPLELVLTKSKDWIYEQEYRIMGSLIDGAPTRLDGNFVPLPDNALKAIILGCENRDRDEIVQMINVLAPRLALRRAVRVANHFKLTIENEAIA